MRRSSSSRELGRATLARQLLLKRADVSVTAALEALAGMQAQVPRPPFVGLWSRVANFAREDLHALVHGRKAVRATLMRGTIHLVSAADFLVLRGALQPMLSRGLKGKGVDVAAVTRHTRALLPARFEQVRAALAKKFPGVDMSWAVKLHVPLVLVPGDARWSYAGNADFHCAEAWLGRRVPDPDARVLVRRYLAAFGPASVKDAQAWSGVRSLAPVFESLRGELRAWEVDGREVFDLPDAPRPDPDAPAPVRLLPEYDNLLLAYADHSRFIDADQRPALTSKNGIVAATFLVDGRVAGTWSLKRDGARATLTLEPFAKLSKAVTASLHAEAEALLRWHEPDAASFTIR